MAGLPMSELISELIIEDFYGLQAQFSADEIQIRDAVRRFVDQEVRPHAAKWWQDGVFPRELIPQTNRRIRAKPTKRRLTTLVSNMVRRSSRARQQPKSSYDEELKHLAVKKNSQGSDS
jgi:hypothetical protein